MVGGWEGGCHYGWERGERFPKWVSLSTRSSRFPFKLRFSHFPSFALCVPRWLAGWQPGWQPGWLLPPSLAPFEADCALNDAKN